jgi:hypothetical protein
MVDDSINKPGYHLPLKKNLDNILDFGLDYIYYIYKC